MIKETKTNKSLSQTVEMLRGRKLTTKSINGETIELEVGEVLLDGTIICKPLKETIRIVNHTLELT